MPSLTQVTTAGIQDAAVGSTQLASSFTVSGNITVGNIVGAHANGNSNINIPSANGNINVSVAGNANILTITGTGANVTGTFNATGNITQAGASLATMGKAIAMSIVFGG